MLSTLKMTKIKYLTRIEKEDKMQLEIQLLVERLEKRFICDIKYNIQDFVFRTKNANKKRVSTKL